PSASHLWRAVSVKKRRRSRRGSCFAFRLAADSSRWIVVVCTQAPLEADTHMRRRFLPALVLAVFASLGAQQRTPNFVVSAPTQQIAQQIGQYAEHYRKQKAVEWLGQEMPNWPQPCPLQV